MWTGGTELCKAWWGSRWEPMAGAAARRERAVAAFLNHDLSLCLAFQRTPCALCITAYMFQWCLRNGSLLGRLWPNHVFQTCLFSPRLPHHHSPWGDITGLFPTGMSGGDLRVGIWVFSEGVSGCPESGYLGVLRVGIWVSSEGVSGCPQRGYLGVLRGAIWVSSEGVSG